MKVPYAWTLDRSLPNDLFSWREEDVMPDPVAPLAVRTFGWDRHRHRSDRRGAFEPEIERLVHLFARSPLGGVDASLGAVGSLYEVELFDGGGALYIETKA